MTIIIKTILIIFSITCTFKDLFPQENNNISFKSDSLKKELVLSLGIGIADYNKSGLAISFELIGQTSKHLHVGLIFDHYNVIKAGGSSVEKFFTASGDLLYKNNLSNNVSFYLGGGVLLLFKSGPIGLNGYFRVDYDFTKSFSLGLIYKQPLFYGATYSAPPLKIFNFVISYKMLN